MDGWMDIKKKKKYGWLDGYKKMKKMDGGWIEKNMKKWMVGWIEKKI